MIGLFLREQAARPPHKVNNAAELSCGQVVVALAQEEKLRRYGLPVKMRFGIAGETGKVICQDCTGSTLEAARFRIVEMSVTEFLCTGQELYVISPEMLDEKQDSVEVYERAHGRLGEAPEGLRSFPGDDFVAECVWGKSMETLLEEKEPAAGRHWATPLKLRPSEVMEWLRISLWGIESAIDACVPDACIPDFEHHGIRIEGDWVIHFSTCRMESGESRIKADSLQNFKSWKSSEPKGWEVADMERGARERLLTRNRAVWVFFHSDAWGKYHFVKNNCEHFCRYCCVGEKVSRQVTGQVMKFVALLLSKGWIPGKYGRIIRALSSILGDAGRTLATTDHIPDVLLEIDHLTTLKP